MNDSFRQTKAYFQEMDASISRHMTPVVKWLMYICGIVFFLGIFLNTPYLFGASFYFTLMQLHVWQLFTYAFVHVEIWHLFFNLLALYFFGTRLEERWGSETFVRFALVTIAGSVLTHLVITGVVDRQDVGVPIIGISGMVYAILLVYALYYPDDIVLVFGIFPIKVKFLVLAMGLMALLAARNPQSGVANLTHLGGMGVGYLFYRYPRFFDRIPLPSFKKKRRNPYDPYYTNKDNYRGRR